MAHGNLGKQTHNLVKLYINPSDSIIHRQEGWEFSFGLRTKIAIVILCIFIIDSFVALFASGTTFWPSKSKTVTLSNLLFFEGIIIFGLGALVASGSSVQRMESWQSLYASPSGHMEYLIQERRKQFSFGTILMIIGAVLIVFSVVVYLLSFPVL